MKFTFNWLKEFVDFRGSPEEIAHALTMAGLEVESVAPLRCPDNGVEDWLFEVAVTPNRGDCLGLIGLAREVAALTSGRLKKVSTAPNKQTASLEKLVEVQIVDPKLCPRYSASVVQDVRVGFSPSWMRFRLESCGIRSINNVVDVTNYAMLETGQPLHAFDLERLSTKRIVVRRAGEVQKFVTLDEVERQIVPEDLLICDGDTPIALAGVMGGMNSEVQPQTRTVLLESAHFDSVSIRRTAKRLGLRSEASHRFERGVDPEGTLYALNRACSLLAECASATPLKGVIDRYPRRLKAAPVLLREDRMNRLLGIKIARPEIEKTLKSLGMGLQKRSKNGLKVTPPLFRSDLTREADLIEELARFHNYERIPSTLPLMRSDRGRIDLRLRRERRLRNFLVGEGMAELINLPFTSEEMNRVFPGLWKGPGTPVVVQNPLVQESAQMRLSLLPGLIGNLRVNLSQKARSFSGFDFGKVFRLDEKGLPEERQSLAGLLFGPKSRRGLRGKEQKLYSWLDGKGLVEGIVEVAAIDHDASWTDSEIPNFLHPGKAACVWFGNSRMGYLGEIHPDLCEGLGLSPVLVFELDFEGLVQYAPRELTARSLPRFPSVERDLAVVVDEAFPSQRIIDWVKGLDHTLIEGVQVFDQYLGSPIPEGKKSLAYKISYRADDRTLTDEEVNGLHQDLVDQIGKVFGAQRRG